MIDSGDASKVRKSTALWLGACLGVVVSLVFHGYVVAKWPTYARSIDPERVKQVGDVLPAPSIASTSLSARHGFVVLLIAGAAVGAFAKKRWLVGGALALTAGLTNTLLWSFAQRGAGNLWPISFALILALSAVPAMLGTACGAAIGALIGKMRSP
jgi:hypothetical protein